MELKFSDEYFRLLSLYLNIGDPQERDNVSDLASILSVTNNSKIALYTARDLFKLRNRTRNSYASGSNHSPFIDNEEKRALEVFLKVLNDYIRYIEGVRFGETKIRSLVVYLLAYGMESIALEIYLPEDIKKTLDEVIEETSKHIDQIVESTIDHYKAFGNQKLSNAVVALGRLIMEQRSDQVVRHLMVFEPNLDYDAEWEYLATQKSSFDTFSKSINLEYLKEKFGVAESTYRRNINIFISDLTSRLDEDNYQLLTELFLKR